MSCASFEPSIVEMARGVAPEADVPAQLTDHLRTCAACAARLEDGRAMTRALRSLAADAVPPADSRIEAALLAAFDARHRAAANGRVGAKWLAFAAAAVLTAGVAIVERESARPSRAVAPLTSRALAPMGALPVDVVASTGFVGGNVARVSTRSSPARSDASFIVWPGTAPLPAFESGELMRVDLPVSVAVSLGLAPRARASRVRADVIVGQDGYVRAVRLAP